jgi:hypothetical protein
VCDYVVSAQPCSESEMGRSPHRVKKSVLTAELVGGFLATEWRETHSVRARLARRVAEKLEQQSEKQVGVWPGGDASVRARADGESDCGDQCVCVCRKRSRAQVSLLPPRAR